MYVSGGSEKANFSIGRFQMKPSFAEEIDQEWNQSTLASEFGFKFDVRNNSDARSSRVKTAKHHRGPMPIFGHFHPFDVSASSKTPIAFSRTTSSFPGYSL